MHFFLSHSNEERSIHPFFSCFKHNDFIRGVSEQEHWNVVTEEGVGLE